MQRRADCDEYDILEGLDRVDFERVQSWLAESYWSPGISLEKVRKAARGSSLVIGVYVRETGEQVGYARVVSDRATFAWIADVYVETAHRGKGLAKAMVRYALDHPEHQGLRRWVLATKDAHAIYAACGFEPLPMPERWMAHLPANHPAPSPGDKLSPKD